MKHDPLAGAAVAPKPARGRPAPNPAPGPPVLIVTRNGKVIQNIIGPPASTDIEWGFGPGGGGGFFTRNGVPIPDSVFFFPPGANDWHFSPTGVFGPGGVPLIPPPWANDVDFEYEGGRIVAGWWTRDGERIEPIPLAADQTEIFIALINAKTDADSPAQDPVQALAEIKATLSGITIERLSSDLAALGQSMANDAAAWKAMDQKDLWALAETALDVVYAQFQLWQIGFDLRIALARAMGAQFGDARDLASSAFFSYSGRPQLIAGMRMGGTGNWDGKIDAVANILEELTGIPFDLIKEFFGAELFSLAYLIKKLIAARKAGKNDPVYKALVKELEALLEKVFEKLIGKKFRDWLIKKLGKEAAEKLIEKTAQKLIPILGWIFFGIEFVALLVIWWEILLDP